VDLLVIFQSAWTMVVFALFIGIAVWAYSGRNQATFDEAARIPLDDDDSIAHDATKHD
jgi:cytochrome c oxidase cbb3-type subunit IV